MLKFLKPSRNSGAACLAVALLALTGCGTLHEETRKKVDSDLQAVGKAQDMMNGYRRNGAVVRIAAAKLAGEEITIGEANKLPDIFNSPFVYVAPPQTAGEVGATIYQRIGIPVVVIGGMGANDSGQAQSQNQNQNQKKLAMSWEGSLKGLLDHLTMQTGQYWRYRNGQIEIFSVETRSFNVYLPTGKRSVTATIALSGGGSGGNSSSGGSGGGGGSDGGGTGSVNIASQMEIDAYGALAKSIGAIVEEAQAGSGANAAGPQGPGGVAGAATTRVVISNPALGLMTVTSTPPVLDHVAAYIKSVNDRLAQNVMISVKVYNLSLNKENNAGFSMDLVYRDMDKYGISMTGATPLSPTNGVPGVFRASVLGASRMSGTELLVQALSQHGDVSLVRSGQVLAANGQPSPLQMANEFTYLQSSATTTVPNVGTTQTLTPGSRTVGFTANFLPMILGDNRILLQYQINLSTLLGLNQVTSGGAMIQTPNISSQSLQQQAFVRDGQTIVLFGFEQDQSSDNKSMGLTGVSRGSSSAKQVMVILMEVFTGKDS